MVSSCSLATQNNTLQCTEFEMKAEERSFATSAALQLQTDQVLSQHQAGLLPVLPRPTNNLFWARTPSTLLIPHQPFLFSHLNPSPFFILPDPNKSSHHPNMSPPSKIKNTSPLVPLLLTDCRLLSKKTPFLEFPFSPSSQITGLFWEASALKNWNLDINQSQD